MKQLVSSLKLFAVITLSAAVWVACSSKGKNVADADIIADSTEVMSQDSDAVAQVPYSQEFSIENLLVMMYGNAKQIQEKGLPLIYKDSARDEEEPELSYQEYVYGCDIEKTDKKGLGYNLKATTKHGFYFQKDLDTSTQASLNFVSQKDATSFFDRASKSEPIKYGNKTYYFHQKEESGKAILYIETPYEEDDFETRFTIAYPELEGGFYRMKIDVWV